MHIGLVSCGKKKLAGKHPAKDLYVSNRFRMALAHATRVCDRVYILSAKHGLLLPEQEISTYDLSLAMLTRDERRTWAERSAAAIRDSVSPGSTLHFFCGRTYCSDLIPMLCEGYTCLTPLRGLSIGRELHYYRMYAP